LQGVYLRKITSAFKS